MDFEITPKGPSGQNAVLIVTTQLDPASQANTVVHDEALVSGQSVSVSAVPGQHIVITVYVNPVVTP